MSERPELIVFSENKLGGVQSYFYNLLLNDRDELFDKKWILYDDKLSNGAKLPEMFQSYPKELFTINNPSRELVFNIAKRLSQKISNRDGVILASFYYELATLHLYRKENKRVYFFCHDEEYVQDATRFEFLIDVFVTHNIAFYEKLKSLFPDRVQDIFYLPYGIDISGKHRQPNNNAALRLLVLSRITINKGVYDLPLIDAGLKKAGIPVEWTIIGNGPELDDLKKQMQEASVKYFNPEHTDEVLDLASGCDLYILPSRLDGLPNALLEAMSVGCVPVISEFNKGIGGVVTNEEGYVLPVGNIASFVDAISQLNSDRSLLEKLSTGSRRKIVSEYNIQNRSKEYYKLFRAFREYKRPYRSKSYKYLGLINHPLFPDFIRKIYSKVKKAN